MPSRTTQPDPECLGEWHRGTACGTCPKCRGEVRRLLAVKADYERLVAGLGAIAALSPPPDPTPRCSVCGWPLRARMEDGCLPGNCSYREGK